jgi:hypothetical protein
MVKKLEGNGLWQTKFMLPQHNEALANNSKSASRIPRPTLDDQELELISAAIGQSYSNRSNVTLTVYDGYQYLEVIGTVTKVDQQLKRLRIDYEDEWEWVNMRDIIKAEVE